MLQFSHLDARRERSGAAFTYYRFVVCNARIHARCIRVDDGFVEPYEHENAKHKRQNVEMRAAHSIRFHIVFIIFGWREI